MSFLTIDKVKIVGLAACVPPTVEENLTLPIFTDESEAKKVIASTGIERKRVVIPGTTASDLSFQAINKLLSRLHWSADSVDALIYVCTSRDYIAPITSAILQDRLGFRNDCYCLDLPLGCSGWVYGMSNLCSLLSHGQLKRGLLVCAETNSLNRSPKDKTVKPLFGDAATVTALEYDEEWNHPLQFSFGVDGSGYQAVWTKYGGTRNPVTPEALEEKEVSPGVIRRGIDMVVNGMDVFSFAIKVPPRSLQEFVDHFQIDLQKIDYLFLHQANRFIDDRIRKKLKLPEEKVPFCLQDYGNTNSASIPLTMVACKANELQNGLHDCLGCGFGVGLAWGCIRYTVENLKAAVLFNYEYN
jgi:3-oxoacyl-[acyl-carrier-protein] synthase-3